MSSPWEDGPYPHFDLGPNPLSCIVYDESGEQVSVSGDMPADAPVRDTDAFASQGDKGPYHWVQGPNDLTPVIHPTPAPTPPVDPSPSPVPTEPGKLPKKGKALTTTNLRLRMKAGIANLSRGVLPTGTEILMTGGRKIIEGVLWVRVQVTAVTRMDKGLKGDDKWISAPPKATGWVNSEYLAVPASEYVAADFPELTHEYLWWLDDSGALDAETVRKTLTAISDDPRGPLRAGIDLREASASDQAHVIIRFIASPCGGAAGCYYKQAGQQARVDIDPKYFNTAWLSRVFLHETLGHAATRCYDHYNNAPKYPRADYYGLMGNWQDQFGDHAWPDTDDVSNMIEWKHGRSTLVFP